MNCKFHPTAEAVTKCAMCGAELCFYCDTNAFFRVEKGALCIRCSLKEAKCNVSFAVSRLASQIRKVIFAAILFAAAIISWVIASDGGRAFPALLVFVFWFLCGFIQTRGQEKDEYSVKSIIWEDHGEDDITLGKVIFYVFAAPVMLIKNFIMIFLLKSDRDFAISKYEKISAALTANNKECFEYWQKEAEKGSVYASICVGTFYLDGEGVEQDKGKAIELFTKAAEQGDSWGHSVLGSCYFYGNGTEVNEEKGVEFWKKAAEQGDNTAQCELGLCFWEGKGGVSKDYAKAAELWKNAAEQEDPVAQCNLGFCYSEGKGVVQDDAKAAELWKKAEERGVNCNSVQRPIDACPWF